MGGLCDSRGSWPGPFIYLKLKNRNLNTEETYAVHQRQFFQTELTKIQSDKFSRIRRRVAGCAFGEGYERALDVATGRGFQARALKEAGIPQVTAVDLVPERIARSRELFPDGIEFRVMDATQLEYPDKHFDCTTVSAALHDMPTSVKRKTLAEIARVTKHRVVIFEPRTFRSPLLSFFYGTLGSLFDESLNFRDYVRDDLAQVLEECGLEMLEDENVWWGVMKITVCRPTDGRGPD